MVQNDLINIISQVGFPIAVAGYVLIRMETTIKENTKAIMMLAAELGVKNTDATK